MIEESPEVEYLELDSVLQGKNLFIYLKEVPSSGFRWGLYDVPQLMSLVDSNWVPDPSAPIEQYATDVPGQRVFHFLAEIIGSEVLCFRLSEESGKSIKEVCFTVKVHPPAQRKAKSKLREEWDWTYDVLTDETLSVTDRLRVIKQVWLD